MIVADLITALQALPGDLEVYTEGCDCFVDVGRVAVCANNTGTDVANWSGLDHPTKSLNVTLYRTRNA
jgi:hypothetical protein